MLGFICRQGPLTLKVEKDLSILKLFKEQKIFPGRFAISIICDSLAIKGPLFSSLFSADNLISTGESLTGVFYLPNALKFWVPISKVQ